MNDRPGPGAEGADRTQTSSFLSDIRGGGGAGEADGAPAKKRSKPSGSTALVFSGVLAGAGVLVAMRFFGLGPVAASAKVDVDYQAPANAKALQADHERVLNTLERSTAAVQAQTPTDKLQKNPFQLVGAQPASEAEAPADDGKRAAELAAKQKAERRGKIESALSQLKLHSVVGGRVPVARLGDQTVKVGDVVSELFTVTAIGGRSVALTVDGETYNLVMDEGEGRGKKGGK
ncbi:MAG: hypothetical protein IT434_08745 [Phycisphaerales bacterium]|jgi:hypothetical protein|nr:hypothetical protein [Phycisphaerales bacterium]